MYQPKPINTDDIVLSEELIDLTEKIAANVHEVWALGRVSDGWSYGKKRDDQLKQTPCLVPYDELPESEKQYDRDTAIQTLKLIVSLGYSIRKDN